MADKKTAADGWQYYNGALIPTCAPHEEPDLTVLNDKSFFSKQLWDGKKPLFARYTTDFGCAEETDFWYVLTDKPFDISEQKSKHRYEINKGIKNFTVKQINPNDYLKSIFRVTVKAYESWPEKYRPKIAEDTFFDAIPHGEQARFFGAFLPESDTLVGYAVLQDFASYTSFNILRIDPDYEKLGLNAAIVYKILVDYADRLSSGAYINDGSRNISHETAFQNYLEKYFGFKKVYCRLRIKYTPKIKFFVKALYPFKRLLKKFDNNPKIHRINAMLKMEEIARSCR